VLVRSRVSSSSRYAKRPASEVITLPRNWSINRRSKSSSALPCSLHPSGRPSLHRSIPRKTLNSNPQSSPERSKSPPHPGNAGLWRVNEFTTPAVAFGTWPTMLYFIFIVASTLRLDFVLPAFTGIVAAAGYLGVATWVLSFQGIATNPNHVIKAAFMVVAEAVAGLVAVRLRAKFGRAIEEAMSRERVTNLFGQHVSPSVVV